jgi:hypothetical protein
MCVDVYIHTHIHVDYIHRHISCTYITYTDTYIHIRMYRGILKVCGTGPEFGTHWPLIWDAAGRMLSRHSCYFILYHHDPTFGGVRRSS